MLSLAVILIGCAGPVVRERPPEERLSEARRDISKKRYEKAYETLEELRLVTAGTKLGGDVQFLLGEAAFRSGKYPEAESQYAAYLNAYPRGPHAEEALYKQALSKIRQLRKRRIGLLSFRSYIPHDRDISLLREARVLFELYAQMYPSGQWADAANELATDLRLKEGQHELGIASFYLKRNRPDAAIARAERVLEGDYPDAVEDDARDLIRRARSETADNGVSAP